MASPSDYRCTRCSDPIRRRRGVCQRCERDLVRLEQRRVQAEREKKSHPAMEDINRRAS
jgi:predicted amidophosphoribosyltransferase